MANTPLSRDALAEGHLRNGKTPDIPGDRGIGRYGRKQGRGVEKKEKSQSGSMAAPASLDMVRGTVLPRCLWILEAVAGTISGQPVCCGEPFWGLL